MKINICRAKAIAAAIGITTTALAAGLDGLEYQKERTVKLKSGKAVTVIVGKMNGQMMAVMPMEVCNDLFLRAEGHSISD
jgi:UDP-N-acetylmuramyl pentapeptide synthase